MLSRRLLAAAVIAVVWTPFIAAVLVGPAPPWLLGLVAVAAAEWGALAARGVRPTSP